MRRRLAPLAFLLVASALAAPSRARAAEERALYAEPAPFGPKQVAFPWFAAFSPDGKWVAFSDGYTPYVEVWDVAKNARVWPTDGKSRVGTHRVAFSADSKEVAFGDGEHLIVLALEKGAWTDAHEITLLEKAPISLGTSPLRIAFETPGPAVLLSSGTGALAADLSCGCLEDVGPSKTDVFAAFAFPDGSKAVSLRTPFSTRVLPAKGAAVDVPGLLLEADAKGTTWLVAPDAKRCDLDPIGDRPEVRLALEVRDARASTARASFEISAKSETGRSLPHRVLIQGCFSPDGRVLATVEGTGRIVLRDAATGAPLQTIHEYEDPPYAMGVAFSPDGSRLLTGGRRREGAQVLLWKRREG